MTRWALVKRLGTAASEALCKPIANGLENGAASHPRLRRLMITAGEAKHRLRTVDVGRRAVQAAVVLAQVCMPLAFVSIIWTAVAGDRETEARIQRLEMDLQTERREIEDIKELQRDLEELKRELRELSREAAPGQKP